MDTIAGILFAVLTLVAPIAGYQRAAAQPGATRGTVLRAATAGGALVGLTSVVAFTIGGREWAHLQSVLPYLAINTAIGAIIGLAGLLARALGGWLVGMPE